MLTVIQAAGHAVAHVGFVAVLFKLLAECQLIHWQSSFQSDCWRYAAFLTKLFERSVCVQISLRRFLE